MANTLQTSINWAIGFLGYSTPTVGPNNEPALSSANMVQQVMTSPPFHFAWNRSSLAFSTNPTTQDYVVTVSDFGYAEKAGFQPVAGGKAKGLAVLNNTALTESFDVQEPVTLGVQLVQSGQVTFRFVSLPNAQYNVTVWYQKFAPLMTIPGNSWLPPDYMSYIYNRGFLAHCLEGKGDPRAQQEKVSFAAALLATHEGLTDTEKNIFLMQYMANPREVLLNQLKTQQGVQARGQ